MGVRPGRGQFGHVAREQPFTDRDLARLVAARSVVAHAERARLVAVSPRGVQPEVEADLVLDASDLLNAWRV
jgi:hypothetical protein